MRRSGSHYLSDAIIELRLCEICISHVDLNQALLFPLPLKGEQVPVSPIKAKAGALDLPHRGARADRWENRMFRPFAEWIANTELNHAFQENAAWLVPTSQSIHIISVCVLFTCAILISMRILGVTSIGRTVSQLTDTLVPWMWGALGVLLLTGTIQTIAEPVRQFVTPVFWAKMIMIVVVMTITAVFTGKVRANAAAWDAAASLPPGARQFAIVSAFLWVVIIVCGRFIGYTWSFYL